MEKILLVLVLDLRLINSIIITIKKFHHFHYKYLTPEERNWNVNYFLICVIFLRKISHFLTNKFAKLSKARSKYLQKLRIPLIMDED